MAHSHTRWAIVMSRNAGFVDQYVELDFQHPSEGYLKWTTEGTMPASPCNHACALLQICLDWGVLDKGFVAG